jgi:starvation-inducible DNA-binding protein
MTDEKLVESLKILLANNYALQLKTQNFHWNITGPHFSSLHSMFEKQYGDLAEASDMIAERIRTLGHKVPASFGLFNKLQVIKDGDENLNDNVMLKALHYDHQTIMELLNKVITEARKLDDEVTIGMMINRLEVHSKTTWMLQSSFD